MEVLAGGNYSNIFSIQFQSFYTSCRVDPTLTVENVTDVIEKVTEDRRRQVWEKVLRIDGYVDEMYGSHSSEKEKTMSNACSDVYVDCHPESSWEHLTSLLYKQDEMTAVDRARTFLPPRGMSDCQ
jgi:hypothetical protein